MSRSELARFDPMDRGDPDSDPVVRAPARITEEPVSAILFGSISTIADTSELQRQAFNEAFAEHGLAWEWDRDTYLSKLETSGGQQRIADHAASVGADVDAAAVHRSKSEAFRRLLAAHAPPTRAGVVATVRAARSAGAKVALVTTTSEANVAALLEAVSPELRDSDFDLIVDTDDVEHPKPEADAYTYALGRLGETAGACVAIEDNLNGVDAAVASGMACVAFPNANTAGHEFTKATWVVTTVDFDELHGLARTS